MKVEMELIKKAQTEGKLEMKNVGTQTATVETGLSSRIQEMKESLGGEDKTEETDTLVKEMLNLKKKKSRHIASRKSGIL